MGLFRAQVVIPFFTNLPTDVITNTFYIWDPAAVSTKQVVGDAITPLLDAFYTGIYSANGAANYADLNLAYVNWYDMSENQPRAPYRVDMPITGHVESGTPIPTEVAMVLSFQGIPVSGVPQARRRGRIYLGAMQSGWFAASTTTSFPAFSPSAITAVVTGAATFKDAVAASASRAWRVFSPTGSTSTDVDNGWVDNSPDTQRRRSVDALSRTLWS